MAKVRKCTRSVHMSQWRGDQAWIALLKILGRSASVQRVVWPERVVEALPVQKCSVERGHLQLHVIQLVELLGMSALRPLDVTVELGRAWR